MLGAPGSLKSMTSLVWGLSLDLPVLMISLDTDAVTQGARVIAHLTGRDTAEIMADPSAYAGIVRASDLPVRAIDRPVAATDVDPILKALADYWGRPPSLVIVDDVSKLKMDREYQAYDEAFLTLHRAARRHHTVVLALHHLHRGDSMARRKQPKLSDGKYTGEYEAELVLGNWRPSPDELRISVLKNRFGEDDPEGGLYAKLYANPATVDIREQTYFETFRAV